MRPLLERALCIVLTLSCIICRDIGSQTYARVSYHKPCARSYSTTPLHDKAYHSTYIICASCSPSSLYMPSVLLLLSYSAEWWSNLTACWTVLEDLHRPSVPLITKSQMLRHDMCYNLALAAASSEKTFACCTDLSLVSSASL